MADAGLCPPYEQIFLSKNISRLMPDVLKRYFKKDLIPLLADLRLAIVLLLVIAVFSILGTVIEQGQ